MSISCRYFRIEDFLQCSETWQKSPVSNYPKQKATIDAIQQVCMTILEPVADQFGKPRLTYGFCSDQLRRKIKRGISPKHDQHAGYELSDTGKRICDRDGIAVDFYVSEKSSLTVARWIVQNLNFDRLYYYGEDRSLHVSIAPHPLGQIVSMTNLSNKGHRVPRVVKSSSFLGSENV